MKVVLLGDPGVGKTTLFWRIREGGRVLQRSHSTLSKCAAVTTDMCRTTIVGVGNETVPVEVWDTAGAERYRTLTCSYYRMASAVILVYSASNPTSLVNLSLWIEEVRNYTPPNTVMILLGNEAENPQENIVLKEAGDDFAAHHGIAVHVRLTIQSDDQYKITNTLKYMVEEVMSTEQTRNSQRIRNLSISLHDTWGLPQVTNASKCC